jgi:allantoicase
VHGEGLLNPDFAANMTLDLAALENGGRITACSNMFYSSPNNLLLPGVARTMGEGWETSRRRDSGNDWVQVHLASRGILNTVELDTSYFVGNAPGSARLSGRDGDGEWFEILPLTDLQPDTRHRFLIGDDRPITEARVDIHPDGGMARVKLYGSLTPDGLEQIRQAWDASG